MRSMRSNMKSKASQKGFTLIELVVVIVILGILAVTAAPKFIDVTSDARKSVMQGIQASLEGAASIAQSKAILAGQTGLDGEIVIDLKYYALVYGYPAAAGEGDADGSATNKGYGVASFIDISGDIDSTTTAGTFTHTGADRKSVV